MSSSLRASLREALGKDECARLLSAPGLMNENAVVEQLKSVKTAQIVAAPYLYVIARGEKTRWLSPAHGSTKLRDFRRRGKSKGTESNRTTTRCMRSLAGMSHASFISRPGAEIALDYLGRTAKLIVTGIVDSGDAEDNQVFVNLAVAQQLSNLDGQIGLVQMNVGGGSKNVAEVAAKLAAALPDYDVHPIRQVTAAEGALLGRLRLLIFSMVALILVLTSLCVLATMAALAIERREDVGLMKALGGSISRVVGLFLAEVGVLGAVGGAIGCIVGMALTRWMGHRVFEATISMRWEIIPLTIALMIAVALAGASPLRMLGNVKPAAIFRGE